MKSPKIYPKTRLETILINCSTCEDKTTYIFLGQERNQFNYKCLTCGETYISPKKLHIKRFVRYNYNRR